MKKYNSYRTVVFTITTVLVFFLWSLIQSSIDGLKGISRIYPALIGAIVSLGSYRLVVTIIENVLIRIPLVKRIILGNTYMEGTWVGVYIGYKDEPRFIIERYEQDFERLIVRGKAYYKDGSFKGLWVSNDVSIDSSKGIITYTYDSDMVKEGNTRCGFAKFYLERENDNSAPIMIKGFTNDLSGTGMVCSFERKIESGSNKKNEKELLDIAKNFYEEYKDIIYKKIV